METEGCFSAGSSFCFRQLQLKVMFFPKNKRERLLKKKWKVFLTRARITLHFFCVMKDHHFPLWLFFRQEKTRGGCLYSTHQIRSKCFIRTPSYRALHCWVSILRKALTCTFWGCAKENWCGAKSRTCFYPNKTARKKDLNIIFFHSPSATNRTSPFASMIQRLEATFVTLRPLAILMSLLTLPKSWWQVAPRSPAPKGKLVLRGKMYTSTVLLSPSQSTRVSLGPIMDPL